MFFLPDEVVGHLESCGEHHVVSGVPGKEPACRCRRCKRLQCLTPGSERSPGVGNGNASPVFLPGKFQGQRRLVGYSPLRLQRIRHNCAHTQSGVPVFKNLSQISWLLPHLNSVCLVVLNINYLLPQKILFDYRISIERGCVVVIRRARNLGIKVSPCSEFVVVFQVSLSEKWGNPIICRVPLSSENNGNIFKKERHACHCKCQRYS